MYINFKLGNKYANRQVSSFRVHGVPFLYNGWEYLELRVKGDSFIRHQIRKMIGLIVGKNMIDIPNVFRKNYLKNIV